MKLADLIAPLTLDAFFRDACEQRPLVQRRPVGRDYDTAERRYHFGTRRAVRPAETLRRIRPLLGRAGITRLADVTGLRLRALREACRRVHVRDRLVGSPMMGRA